MNTNIMQVVKNNTTKDLIKISANGGENFQKVSLLAYQLERVEVERKESGKFTKAKDKQGNEILKPVFNVTYKETDKRIFEHHFEAYINKEAFLTELELHDYLCGICTAEIRNIAKVCKELNLSERVRTNLPVYIEFNFGSLSLKNGEMHNALARQTKLAINPRSEKRFVTVMQYLFNEVTKDNLQNIKGASEQLTELKKEVAALPK